MNLPMLGVAGQAGSGKDTVADYLVSTYGFTKVALADPLKRLAYKVFDFSEDQLWGPSSSRDAIDLRYEHKAFWDTARARLAKYGLDFVSDALNLHHYCEAVVQALGSLASWFSWLEESFRGKLSPRIVLQTLGTEWGRGLNSTLWVDYLARVVTQLGTRGVEYDKVRGLTSTLDMWKMLRTEPPHIRGVVVSDLRFPNELEQLRRAGGKVIRIVRPHTDGAAATLGIAGHASEVQDAGEFDLLVVNDKDLAQLYNAIDIYLLTIEN